MPKQPINDGDIGERRTIAWVEYEDDYAYPGRRCYRITSKSKEAVQIAIDARMRIMEDCSGFANFIGPYRFDDGFVAIGETLIK